MADQKRFPKPPVVVGGYGSPSIPLNRTVKGSINYQYPPDFPEDSRAAVKLEEIRAARQFSEKSKDTPERNLRAMLLVCAMRPALAFAREMIQLRWGADRIDSRVRDFVQDALSWVDLPTNTDFEASAEWREYQDALLGMEASEETTAGATGKERGYRAEIQAWMASMQLENLDQASRRLGLSKSALKSIMSTKGKPRYSQETLKRVLTEIGYRN